MQNSLRPHDWAYFVAIVAVVAFVAAMFRGNLLWASTSGIIAFGAALVSRRWSQKSPGPMPYAIRWLLYLSPHAPQYLKRILRPRAGEHILEIGPGVGHHALAIASSLAPQGALEVLDIQQEMLDAVARRAAAAGITNIVIKQGDAQRLPYSASIFDAAYLSGVLGEIPDQRAALRELRRVLKPEGRLVIAEAFIDPDYVPLSKLCEEARDAGFAFEEKLGPSFACFARFGTLNRTT